METPVGIILSCKLRVDSCLVLLTSICFLYDCSIEVPILEPISAAFLEKHCALHGFYLEESHFQIAAEVSLKHDCRMAIMLALVFSTVRKTDYADQSLRMSWS